MILGTVVGPRRTQPWSPSLFEGDQSIRVRVDLYGNKGNLKSGPNSVHHRRKSRLESQRSENRVENQHLQHRDWSRIQPKTSSPPTLLQRTPSLTTSLIRILFGYSSVPSLSPFRPLVRYLAQVPPDGRWLGCPSRPRIYGSDSTRGNSFLWTRKQKGKLVRNRHQTPPNSLGIGGSIMVLFVEGDRPVSVQNRKPVTLDPRQ